MSLLAKITLEYYCKRLKQTLESHQRYYTNNNCNTGKSHTLKNGYCVVEYKTSYDNDIKKTLGIYRPGKEFVIGSKGFCFKCVASTGFEATFGGWQFMQIL